MKLKYFEAFILLVLPGTALIAFVLFSLRPRGDGDLTLVRSEFKAREVRLSVKYNSPSRLPEWITQPQHREDLGYISSYDKSNTFSSLCSVYRIKSDYTYEYYCNFVGSDLPAKGKLVFTTDIIIDGKQLPVTLVLRKS